jgi:hypothetical protein
MIRVFERYGGIILAYFGNGSKIQFEGKHSRLELDKKDSSLIIPIEQLQ